MKEAEASVHLSGLSLFFVSSIIGSMNFEIRDRRLFEMFREEVNLSLIREIELNFFYI